MLARLLVTFTLGSVAMVTLLWEVFAQVNAHPVVETVWPTSVAGWIGIMLTTITFCALVWTAIKKPGEAAAKAVEDRVTTKLDALKVSLDSMHVDEARDAGELKEGLSRERKEFNAKLDAMHRAASERDEKLRVLSENMVQSREDRRHLTQRLEELHACVDRWRIEDRQRDDRMLEAMVQLRGGKNA